MPAHHGAKVFRPHAFVNEHQGNIAGGSDFCLVTRAVLGVSPVEPEDDRDELDGGQEDAGKLVIARRDGSKSLDSVEESLDEVPLALQGEVGFTLNESVGLGGKEP